ncbi:ribosomal protein S18-alanine N-acetyltransferase [Actinorhabdospora filicis]|nr:ribosomal protein S18-alanine N-acetyltransferase [Actinorhabdospora filicis]
MRWWHIEALEPIEREVFAAEAWSPAMFWSELAAGHHYLVAVEDGELAGYAGLAVTGDEAWINNIAVVPLRRGHGLGRRMVGDLLDEARRRGAATVALEVAVDNAPAQRLYDSYGFEQIGVRRGYYQATGTDALVMIKELS